MDTPRAQGYSGNMGIFSRGKQAQPITFEEAIVALGLPPGTILRESEEVLDMWCPQTHLPSSGDADCYQAQLFNMGTSVAVMVGGKAVSKLDDRCLSTAVKVLKKHGGNSAPAVLILGREGRKTDKVLARR